MNLRQRTILVMALGFVSLLGALYTSVALIVNHRFSRLETQAMVQNLQRVQNVLNDEVMLLEKLAFDWGVWDEIYAFVGDRNPEFVDSNFDSETFLNLGINVVVIADLNGNILVSKAVDLTAQAVVELPPGTVELFEPGRPIVTYTPARRRNSGFIQLEDQILFFAAQGILPSDQTAGEIQGTLLFGKLLNTEQVKHLKDQTKLDIELKRLETPTARQAIAQQLATTAVDNQASAMPFLRQNSDRQRIWAAMVLQAINSEPIAVLEVVMPRTIAQEGRILLTYVTGALVVVSLVFGALILVDLERHILSRLARLTQGVQQVGESHDLTQRMSITGRDELAQLGQQINQMLTELERSTTELQTERANAERLLLNILPEPIAAQLKSGETAIAEQFEAVTILFADIVGFTQLSAQLSAVEVVQLLNQAFSQFDGYVEELGLEKIKTIGDAYMVAAGLPIPRPDHAEAIAQMALKMQTATRQLQLPNHHTLQLRVGINTGVVVAGVIGTKKFIYDLWGDTVNIASRMESHGQPGRIQVTEHTYHHLKGQYEFEPRGIIEVKGRGPMSTYWLVAPK